VGSPGGKTPKRICTRNGSKRVKSAKDVPFGGFVKKGHPTPTSPQIPKILYYKSRFSLKTRINPVVKRPQKFVVGFSNLGLKI